MGNNRAQLLRWAAKVLVAILTAGARRAAHMRSTGPLPLRPPPLVAPEGQLLWAEGGCAAQAWISPVPPVELYCFTPCPALRPHPPTVLPLCSRAVLRPPAGRRRRSGSTAALQAGTARRLWSWQELPGATTVPVSVAQYCRPQPFGRVRVLPRHHQTTRPPANMIKRPRPSVQP